MRWGRKLQDLLKILWDANKRQERLVSIISLKKCVGGGTVKSGGKQKKLSIEFQISSIFMLEGLFDYITMFWEKKNENSDFVRFFLLLLTQTTLFLGKE